MNVRFLLGPAGSGKTHRCLAEVRAALGAGPEGPPLVLLAPKQATYQLERQLLDDPALPGYTRLRVLSFDRLARHVLMQLHQVPARVLDDEGRVMVLRGLLTRRRQDLKLFRASARLTGFAQQLSRLLGELQREGVTPEMLRTLSAQVASVGLSGKLHDLAGLLQDYQRWLAEHDLQDAEGLLARATTALQDPKPARGAATQPGPPLRFGSLWLDGFAELASEEVDFLAALLPRCDQATLAFCLNEEPASASSWLSNWSVVGSSYQRCRRRLEEVAGGTLDRELLPRRAELGRFAHSPVLNHLERYWEQPEPFPENPSPSTSPAARKGRAGPKLAGGSPGVKSPEGAGSEVVVARSLRLAMCADPEGEVTNAAREILAYVRAGGRYRDTAVLVRQLDAYHEPVRKVFSRYQIPFFLDRRESVAHHPMAELTRSALRTVSLGWQHEDWFAALKTGLVPASEEDIDWLENEALARGWVGAAWHKPLVVPGDDRLTRSLTGLRQRVLPPFEQLQMGLAGHRERPTGSQLAVALRAFWDALEIEEQLDRWSDAESTSGDPGQGSRVHRTVWKEMDRWLENLELAFGHDALPMREWLPILEAGLGGMTVGVVPPALDQVLVGAVDRSRNPDLQLAIVLGLNEGVFPAVPNEPVLLTEQDRRELERRDLRLGGTARHQLGLERYYAYIAFTRARQRLVLTASLHDQRGSPLNPSPFLGHLRSLFPSAAIETIQRELDWRQAAHPTELVGPVLASTRPGHGPGAGPSGPNSPEGAEAWRRLTALAGVGGLVDQALHLHSPEASGLSVAEATPKLSPAMAARLYGPVLRTSVSRMEQFAACPFKFFVHSGLGAQERALFELDVREQGTFQHDVLAEFHDQLAREGKRWRDVTPAQARERIAQVALRLTSGFRDGLLSATEQSRFTTSLLVGSLQDFVEVLVSWMHSQYQFDPVAVELPFGEDPDAPAWQFQLPDGHSLAVYGRIDRVDLLREEDGQQALCVVIDYKSSPKQLDPVLIANGLQLQLPTYLSVLRQWPHPRTRFGVQRLVPAGVFYVNLSGYYERTDNRRDSLSGAAEAQALAYRHTGRFDSRVLPHLDSRPGVTHGDQFNYRLTKQGKPVKNSREAMDTADFTAMLDGVETRLREMGTAIYSGEATVAPFRRGTLKACDQCSYQAICRTDPWTQRYRVLGPPKATPA